MLPCERHKYHAKIMELIEFYQWRLDKILWPIDEVCSVFRYIPYSTSVGSLRRRKE